ncbi:hypothetical protein DE146DRAFT_637248 [Phaeosphaeria sp. MPI-PUGE-AT-0046c]|nr:hypothetical protein DE146DRAFT_637248 [Phaeosphaeria sp. MPI-PUGE-AT-0046c]
MVCELTRDGFGLEVRKDQTQLGKTSIGSTTVNMWISDLSDADLERPTGVMWGVLALHGLKSNMQRVSGTLNEEATQARTAYAACLQEVVGLFRLEDTTGSTWLNVPEAQRADLLCRLRIDGTWWNEAHSAGAIKLETFLQLLQMLEQSTTAIGPGSAGSGGSTHEQALGVRYAIAESLYDRLGDDVLRFVGVARAVIATQADKVRQLDQLSDEFVQHLYRSIAASIQQKTNGIGMLETIAPQLELGISDAMHFYWEALEDLGEGVLGSESSDVFNGNALMDMFYCLAEIFSFESDLLKDPGNDGDEDMKNDDFLDDDEGEEEHGPENLTNIADCIANNIANGIAYNMVEEGISIGDEGVDYDSADEEFEPPLPEHIRNHDFAQYGDEDWYADQYMLHDAQDVLRGPQNVSVDQIAMPIGTMPDPCLLCGDENVTMQQLAVCGHIICEVCLSTQLKTKHECRYKCAFCRAEFLPSVPQNVF